MKNFDRQVMKVMITIGCTIFSIMLFILLLFYFNSKVIREDDNSSDLQASTEMESDPTPETIMPETEIQKTQQELSYYVSEEDKEVIIQYFKNKKKLYKEYLKNNGITTSDLINAVKSNEVTRLKDGDTIYDVYQFDLDEDRAVSLNMDDDIMDIHRKGDQSTFGEQENQVTDDIYGALQDNEDILQQSGIDIYELIQEIDAGKVSISIVGSDSYVIDYSGHQITIDQSTLALQLK